MPIKSNRKVALSLEHKKRGEYEQVESVQLEPGTARKVYVEQVKFALVLVKSRSSKTKTAAKVFCIW